jgi:threonine dehydrogenase-like Zn-dependent dehydrogenase
MKGVVFLGDRKLELREFPDPIPGPRDVILEIKASGMCGSDLHNYRAPANPGGVVTGPSPAASSRQWAPPSPTRKPGSANA